MKFCALPDTWYDKGTEVIILEEYGTVYDIDGTPSLNILCRGYCNGKIDEEMCCSEEFTLVSNDYFPHNPELYND